MELCKICSLILKEEHHKSTGTDTAAALNFRVALLFFPPPPPRYAIWRRRKWLRDDGVIFFCFLRPLLTDHQALRVWILIMTAIWMKTTEKCPFLLVRHRCSSHSFDARWAHNLSSGKSRHFSLSHQLFRMKGEASQCVFSRILSASHSRVLARASSEKPPKLGENRSWCNSFHATVGLSVSWARWFALLVLECEIHCDALSLSPLWSSRSIFCHLPIHCATRSAWLLPFLSPLLTNTDLFSLRPWIISSVSFSLVSHDSYLTTKGFLVFMLHTGFWKRVFMLLARAAL